MKATSDAIYRPQWLAFYDATSAREAFDVVCPSRPVHNLGYLVFHVTPFVPGGYSYTAGFQARTLYAFGGRS